MPEPKTISGFVRDVYNIDPSLPFIEDSDGNLVGRPSVTCIGVFPYLMEDGSIFNELRLPEEVFSQETLDSLRMIPVTNDHPNELVTPDNIKKYQVGVTGEDVCRADFYHNEDGAVDSSFFYKTDGTQVTIPVKITERAAIDAVKAGKRGLSCGYTRDLEVKEGVWNGIAYNGIQRNIRMNHLAICDVGRAGDSAVIRMDSIDNNKTFVPTYIERVDNSVVKTDKKGVLNKEGTNMPKKLTLDSTTYEVEEKVVDAYEAAIKDRDSLQGQLDMANAQIQSLRDEMSGMIKADELDAKVKEFQSVKDTANKFGVSLEDGMSITDMKKAIIKVANPAIASTIDSKSADYIDGAFGLCESMAPATDACGGKKKEQDAGKDDKDQGKDDSVNDKDDVRTMSDAVNERLQKKFSR